MKTSPFFHLYSTLHTRILLCAFCALLAYACSGGQKTVASEEPGDALVSDSTALSYVVELPSSYITWIGSKLTEKHYGQIALSEGAFFVENGQLSSGSVTIDMHKLSVAHPEEEEDAEKLRTHLLSADFFEVEAHPTAYFELVSVRPHDTSALQNKAEYESEYKPELSTEHIVESPTHDITANLVICGQKRMVSFPARVEMNESQLVVEAKFNIDRTEWDISYGDENSVVDKAKDKFIYNTVNVGFYLEATLEANSGAGTSEELTQQESSSSAETASF